MLEDMRESGFFKRQKTYLHPTDFILGGDSSHTWLRQILY